MAKDLYCPHCKGYVGNCGHIEGGSTNQITLGGTCPHCRKSYSVTCYGDCLKKSSSSSSASSSESSMARIDDTISARSSSYARTSSHAGTTSGGISSSKNSSSSSCFVADFKVDSKATQLKRELYLVYWYKCKKDDPWKKGKGEPIYDDEIATTNHWPDDYETNIAYKNKYERGRKAAEKRAREAAKKECCKNNI